MKKLGIDNVLDSRITQALADKEWGDARSYLDELNSTGTLSIKELNLYSDGVLWGSTMEVGTTLKQSN
jgi:hypothetical protein